MSRACLSCGCVPAVWAALVVGCGGTATTNPPSAAEGEVSPQIPKRVVIEGPPEARPAAKAGPKPVVPRKSPTPPTPPPEVRRSAPESPPADPLRELTPPERGYAESYLRWGRPPPIPEIVVNELRPLSTIRDGEYGVVRFTGLGLEVRQVVNGREFLASGPGQTGREHGDFWVEGANTAGMIDGAIIDPLPLIRAGTKRYVTTSGATRTVRRFVFLDAAKIEKLVRPETERRAREEKGREAADAARRAAEEGRRRAVAEKMEPAARAALRKALALLDGTGTHDRGLDALREVDRRYPGTYAARDARRVLDMEEAKERALGTPDPRAEANLRYAKKLIDQGMTEKARERLKEIVDKFPPSSTREEARRTLKKLEEDIGK
jgi:hypothetical protein